ncbi:LUD domain-containing protein [Halosquirtibacter xylanolyticus]|uniref:LutC/YkgG family protein n=1 Tax=Halosquirtibacter xylanolyticus TaxID=3374599 RepID=UPI0037495536|nr:LUD domain-containing protein [Prolixibacteraceae bacterium]
MTSKGNSIIDRFTQSAIAVTAAVKVISKEQLLSEKEAHNFKFISSEILQQYDQHYIGKEGVDEALVEVNHAIADTGTVVLECSNEQVRTATCVAEHLYVIVKASSIVECSHDIVDFMAENTKNQGGYIAFISGPSRTADIERVLTVGAHGPRELTIFIVSDL